jgi:hypothetical protein
MAIQNLFGAYGQPQPIQTGAAPNLSSIGSVPQASFPSWFSQQPATQALQAFQQQLPNYFNFSGMNKQFNAQNTAMLSSQRAAAGAAATAQTNRAMQSGGSPMGAGFAQGQMNQNAYNSSLENQLKYNQMKMGARAQEAGIGAGVAGQISSLGQQQQGLMANYAQGQQALGLQAQGQLLNQQSLYQSGANSNTQNAFQYAQLMRSLLGSQGPGSQGGFNGQMTGIGNSGGTQYTPQFQAYLSATGQGQAAMQGVPGASNTSGYNMGGSPQAFNAYNQSLGQLASMANGAPWYNQNVMAGPQGGYNSTTITGMTPTNSYPGGIPYGTMSGQVPQGYVPGGYGASLGATPQLTY